MDFFCSECALKELHAMRESFGQTQPRGYPDAPVAISVMLSHLSYDAGLAGAAGVNKSTFEAAKAKVRKHNADLALWKLYVEHVRRSPWTAFHVVLGERRRFHWNRDMLPGVMVTAFEAISLFGLATGSPNFASRCVESEVSMLSKIVPTDAISYATAMLAISVTWTVACAYMKRPCICITPHRYPCTAQDIGWAA